MKIAVTTYLPLAESARAIKKAIRDNTLRGGPGVYGKKAEDGQWTRLGNFTVKGGEALGWSIGDGEWHGLTAVEER